MRFTLTFTITSWFLGVAQCVPSRLAPRVPKDLEPSPDSWEMSEPGGSSSLSPTWVADRQYGEMDTIQELYLEASKGFNWVKQQERCLTSNGNLLVAAYYDEFTQGLYISTIPRSTWSELMLSKNHGQIWQAHYRAQGRTVVHAEDGAYFWREVKSNMTPLPEGTDPLDIFYGKNTRKGSKVAVWGETGSDATRIKTARGRPIPQCADECAPFAEHMGVYIEPPQ